MDLVDWVQWPAMAVTVLSAWFIGSQRPRRRMLAFWGFILSNTLWVAWGWHTNAYGLIVLECILLGMNARGFTKNLRAQRNAG
ncbi:hypothetical protein [Pseudomonas trivialis]|uniref:Amino acid transporter n=1 Tax=Pseudomonas trivialis TaxID=200450 RepID=A0A0R2ZKB7_9PSED|nr:hypothetical protein [Pseudomonas trivialis]KRP58641.1 amino acid transporter [Pseudomonas trivialis]SDS74761.1 hypothetical protein SAMN04490205_3505 [Pseudomonas trivialis]